MKIAVKYEEPLENVSVIDIDEADYFAWDKETQLKDATPERIQEYLESNTVGGLSWMEDAQRVTVPRATGDVKITGIAQYSDDWFLNG